MSEEQVRNELQKGYCSIVFVKLDGSKRNAIGTTNLDLIPTSEHPKEHPIRKAWKKRGYVRFFDLTIMAWRMLLVDRIVECEVNALLNGLRP